MDEPKPLDSLFKEKLFRIPDYQRGYAWGREQLADFWEDLVNLPDGRSHYTGVLTLKEVPNRNVDEDAKEFWLIDDHSYKLYHIVDGQQRLTTFTLFLQAFIELLRGLPENEGLADNAIYLTDTLSIAAVESKFLFDVKPAGKAFRTYKFGYTVDNPSYEYMRFRILGESGGGTVFETFYTLNLSNGKRYFKEQLRAWHEEEGIGGLKNLYRTLTKRFLFNEYIIKDEFDVFVAFETMNNRGKTLSDLELLKNRLIYLTTLYTDAELDHAERKDLRDLINDAWKEVYFQLGRNKSKPLNDDDFLRAHWMMYFKFSRQTGRDYIKFLLEEQFTPQRVHRKVVQPVELEEAEEQTSEADLDTEEDNGLEELEASEPVMVAELRPSDIRDYVKSLKASSVHWFRTFYPDMSDELPQKETEWIQRLNRLGMTYFRPLLMAILKNIDDSRERVRVFKEIERFVFVVFRLTQTRSNYRSSEFSNAVRAIDRGDTDVAELKERLRSRMSFTFTDEGHFATDDFYLLLQKKFENDQGYYGWTGLRYFLYEYELSLLSNSRQKKLDWTDLLKTPKDKVSIEHIYPQTASAGWKPAFKGIRKREREAYRNSLGNLLLLSSAINSSLQNDPFKEKRKPKCNRDGTKLRNGYADGSHSEIEVSHSEDWGPDEIRERGIRLLKFMEKRWGIRFADDAALEELLFIDTLVDGDSDKGEADEGDSQ
ncbi:hypothetical protein Pla108_26910 [Botrimarina colliarenosi]|uniref:DUF262 domain-containing protein n=1 Tax=Botrimarina colliarenosi TaxID=2528001 RepID=A0A5C6ACN3_9BACT|nr:DUF262 domain-containing protein [Botrimarina colliarenosi]TWT96915.1 hypothetical protein Pla108_26910 [Botrimarina colliarenosi]